MLIIGGMIDCNTQYNKSKFKYVLMQSKFELDAVLKSEFQKGSWVLHYFLPFADGRRCQRYKSMDKVYG